MERILVVEDDPALALNLEALLKVEGYGVTLAADGEAAVERARKQKPDLLLLDVLLPKLGGFEVCRILKSDPKTAAIKVLVLTGLGTMGDVERAYAAGADDYLMKPYEPERLIRKIQKVLRGDART